MSSFSSWGVRWDFLRTQLQNLWPFHHLDLWSWFVCHFYCGGSGGGCRAASQQDHCWKTIVCIVVLVFMSLTSCPSFTSSRPCLWRCCMTAQWRQHLFLFLFKVGDKQEDDLDFSVPFTSDGGFTLRKLDGANYSLSTWHSPRRSTDETDECGLLLFLSTDVMSTFIPPVQNYNWTVTPPQFLRILLVLFSSFFQQIFL